MICVGLFCVPRTECWRQEEFYRTQLFLSVLKTGKSSVKGLVSGKSVCFLSIVDEDRLWEVLGTKMGRANIHS